MGGSAKDMELFQDIDSGSELEGDHSDDDGEVENVKKVKAVKVAVVKKEKAKKAAKSDPAEEEVRNSFFILLTWKHFAMTLDGTTPR